MKPLSNTIRRYNGMPITVTGYSPTVPPGPYQATCTDVRERAAKSDPTNMFRVWEFTLDDGRTTSGSSSLSTSPRSKGGKWLAALLGRAPAEGETVEPIGLRATIIVELDDNTGYEKVTTVAPPESRGAKARPAVAEAVAAAEAGTLAPAHIRDMALEAAEQHALQEREDLPF